jgi:hypothetical protein
METTLPSSQVDGSTMTMPLNIDSRRLATEQSQRRIYLRSVRSLWNVMYNSISAFFLCTKQEFTRDITEGLFLNDGSIFDSTGIMAARAMTSAVVGATWKGASKTFRIAKPYFLTDNQENRDFYNRVSMRIWQAFDNPRANFVSAYTEEMEEHVVYGTSALAMPRGETLQDPFRFQAWPLMYFYISRGVNGEIDTVYHDFKLPVKEAVQTYGLENVSATTRAKFEAGVSQAEDKVYLCEAIEPRNVAERVIPGTGTLKSGKLGMPYKSITFEYNNDGWVVEESGYDSLPVYVDKLYSLPNETYGRSCAMDALPTVIQLNAVKEILIHGAEVKTRPAMWATNNAVVQSGMVDLSPGAINTFDVMGAMTQAPIQPIFDVGELQSLTAFYEHLREEVLQHFNIDKLYDLGNQVRQTLGEAEMRAMIRSDALTPIYSKAEKKITWAIERGANILFDMGLLGIQKDDFVKQHKLAQAGIEPIIIPDEVEKLMAAGMDWYDVIFISPAHRAMRAEEYKGTMDFLNIQMALAKMGVMGADRLDGDALMELLPDISGADQRLIRPLEETKADRDQQAKAAAARYQAEIQKLQAEANQCNAQANASNKNAQTMDANMQMSGMGGGMNSGIPGQGTPINGRSSPMGMPQ